MTIIYVVEKHEQINGRKPFAVVATNRGWNTVIGKYVTEYQAKRRARDLNRLFAK